MYLLKEKGSKESTQSRKWVGCSQCICWKRRGAGVEGVCTHLEVWKKAGFSTHGVITLENYGCPYWKTPGCRTKA